MSQIEVDPDPLHDTGVRLREAVAVAVEVRRSHSSLTGLAEASGHAGLADLVDTFVDRWHHGLGCLVDDAERLAEIRAREVARRAQGAAQRARDEHEPLDG